MKSNKQNDSYIIKSKIVNDFISVRFIKTNLINQKKECKTESCFEGGTKIVISIRNEPIITMPNTHFPSLEKSIYELNQSPNSQKNKEEVNKPEDIFNRIVQNICTWCENNYNSQSLHYKIALPLLRKLREVGNTKFQIILQQTVLWSYREGNYHVKNYLKNDGYLELIGDFF